MGEATPTVSRDLPVPGEAPNLASRLFVLPFTPRHPASSSSLGLAFVHTNGPSSSPGWNAAPALPFLLCWRRYYLRLSSFTHLLDQKLLRATYVSGAALKG